VNRIDVDPATIDLADIVDTASRFVTTEYASLTSAGRPVTWPVTPYRGEHGTTLDVSTGLTYPLKAERARRDRRVALSFSYPAGSGLDPAPTIVVQGLATVRDADLVATSARYLRASAERFPEMMGKVPTPVLRRMGWYWTRIWIEVTPVRVVWWDGGDLARPPRSWAAPDGLDVPPSDPAPAGSAPGSWAPPPADWRARASHAIERLGHPVLTTVDADGHPLPLRTRHARAEHDGFVVVAPVGVEVSAGPCALTFHTHRPSFDGQENVGLVGTATVVDHDDDGAAVVRVRVDRALADWGVPRNPLRSALAMTVAARRLRPRLVAEAARRGTPLPTYEQVRP
jgi:hypothetical protein